MNSFTGVVEVFYVLFGNKHFRNMAWWLLPLFVNCEILNVDKTIEPQKQSSGGVLLKKVLLKILKNHRKTPAPESLFWLSSRLRTATLLKRDSNTGVFL